MKPDPEPWYNTTLNLWQLAGVLVAGWSLAKTVTAGWRLTIGRRQYLTTRLRKIAPGVRHDYVDSLMGASKWQSTMTCTRLGAGETGTDDKDREVEITVRTWPLSRLGYLVTWSEDDTVILYGLTTTSWWFRPKVLVDQTLIRLGKTPLAAVPDQDTHRAWLGNRRYGYVESHYFGNQGGYRSWYVGVNDMGYNALPVSEGLFDGTNESRTRLLPDKRAAYRASAPINTVVISGMAPYEELQDCSFFGISVGADLDLVRLADPEFHVLDGRISRMHQRFRDWVYWHQVEKKGIAREAAARKRAAQ
ncbi:ETEC_3214 domain-containing protein [Streptomyces sp. DT193]|uniref:ETEC_3214 domain-containing protein n=1 Tax=Streptomyces sp. DT193 TaxID=3393418 RepID=UPI003CED36D0